MLSVPNKNYTNHQRTARQLSPNDCRQKRLRRIACYYEYRKKLVVAGKECSISKITGITVAFNKKKIGEGEKDKINADTQYT